MFITLWLVVNLMMTGSGICVQVHIRVASPPLRYPCYMGINIPTHDELIANRLDLQQLAEYIGTKLFFFAHVVTYINICLAGLLIFIK